jgi:lysophospholipase-2
VEYLGLVIKEEVERLPAEGKVVVGGFSMGCAMSVFLLMSGELERLGVEDRVAGLVGWSGWVQFRRQIEEAVGKGDVRGFVRRLVGLREWDEGWDGDGRGFKVWLGHGKEDEKVLLEWGTQMRDLLTMMGYEVSWNEYAGLGHWYLPGELEDIVRFVEQAVQI